MGLMENLLEDHKKLRGLVQEMVALIGKTDGSVERLEPATLARVSRMVDSLLVSLRAHEALEDRFLAEIQLAAEAGIKPLIETIRSEHGSLREIFRILSVLTDPSGEDDAYSIRFAIASLASQIERHLSFEEKESFPLMKRLLSPALLEASASRIAGLLGQAGVAAAKAGP